MRVFHVITNLGQGGAEGVLYRLISASPPDLEHVVVSMMGDEYFGPQLCAAGIKVHALNMPRGRITLKGVLKLRQLIVDARPDVVQTWMYHADLVGGLIARWAGVQQVVWGIRNSNLDPDQSSFSARVIVRICSSLSAWIPAAIVCCSEQAARVHQGIGYCAEKFTIIPNGYDVSRFAPDAEMRERTRLEWGIQPDQPLLGMVARWDPQKDHDNLLHALAQLADRGVIFRCALVGPGMDQDNAALVGKIARLGLTARMILAGPHDDIPAVMNALDLHVLSSAYGEAFPNVVAEAMACGTPSVVTDVGDAALIVGPTGWVVDRGNSKQLAEAIVCAIVELGPYEHSLLSSRCRARIVEDYNLDTMIASFCDVWKRGCGS